MATLQETLRAARSVVVLAGAGLSTASGLSTFRGPGGLWRTHNALSLATPEAFNENPSRVWEFYEYRRQKALLASPNAAHILLAHLSYPTHRSTVLPSCTSFTQITQNVDSLSPRAIADLSSSAGSSPDSPLIEMHGSLVTIRCTKCGVEDRETGGSLAPLCPALAGVVERVDAAKEAERLIPLEELPRCREAGCGGLVRPAVVWFGEIPREMGECERALKDADVLLVVGTSGTVYPAAGFAALVQRHGGKVAVLNVEASPGDDDDDFLVLGKCEETLPKAFGI